MFNIFYFEQNSIQINIPNENKILYQNEEDVLDEEEEEEDIETQYIPYEISDCFNFLADFQEEIIKNLNEELPLSIPVIKFISDDQSKLFQFEEFLYKSEDLKKNIIKIALQLVSLIINSRRPSNYTKLHELLSYFKDDIISLFKSNELIDIFINDKQSIYILYELSLITIQDLIAIPFTTQNKPSHFLLNLNENNVTNTKNIPKNNQNSLIRRSFSTSATIFNVTSNFSSNIRSSTNTNFKLSGNSSTTSSSGFNLSTRKMSLDYSTIQKTNSNNNDNNNSNTNTTKFEFTGSPNEEIISLFHPEIAKFDPIFIRLFPNLFGQSKKFFENEENKEKLFFDYRIKFQNETSLAQTIFDDNVEEFHNLLSNSNVENIDSITINHSIFERIEFLNDKRNPPKILEFAAFCGSVKIFKFLLLDIRGNSSSSSLPPLHLYQQQQFQQREQLIKQQRDQLFSLQNKQGSGQIGLVQKQQQIHIQKQQEQLMKFQAQYQQKFQQQQSQFQQQQQKIILNKMPPRLHLFACAGGNAEIIHILEQEGVFSDEKKKIEAIEISINFHQNKIFDYLIERNKIEPTVDLLITCVKSCNYYCFLALFDQFHSSLVCDINKKGKDGENVLHVACALGRLPFVQFLTSIDYEMENERRQKSRNSSQSSVDLNVNVRDSNGFSPLHLAAAGGHIEIIKYLVSFYNKKSKNDQEAAQIQSKQVSNSPFPKLNSASNSPAPRPKTVSPKINIINPLNPSLAANSDQNSSSIIQNTKTNAAELSKTSNISDLSSQVTKSITNSSSLLNPSSQETNSITNPSSQTDDSILNQNSLSSPNSQAVSSITSTNLPASSDNSNTPENSNTQDADLSPITQSSLVSPSSPNSVSMSRSSSLSPTPNLISNSKSAPSSPKLVTLPSSNLLSSKSTSIRRKINANSVSFSKTVSLGSLSLSSQIRSSSRLNLNVKDFKGKSSAQLGYENGFSDVSKFLVSQEEFEINARDDSGIALIHIVSMNNDLDFLVFMTKEAKSRIDVNIETKKSRQTAFLIAASNGNLEMVKYLIGLDAVNKKCCDIRGQMAHHIACSAAKSKDNKKKDQVSDIEDDERKESYIKKYTNYYLINNIRLNNTKDRKRTEFNSSSDFECSDSITKNHESIEINDDRDSSIQNQETSELSDDRDSENKSEGDKKAADSLETKSDENSDENGFADGFFNCSNLDVLRFLINNHGFDVNSTDGSKQTPLHHACIIGDFGLVRFLVSVSGVDINARDSQGRTPLVLSFTSGNLSLAKFLLEETNASIRSTDNDGRNALHLSAQLGHIDNVTYIFSLQDKLKQQHRDKTALNRHHNRRTNLYGADNDSENENENESDFELAESNLELDVNQADNYGRTCLHLSFESGNTELIKFILNRRDIDLNARDKGGRTLLHFAASFNYMFVVQFLESQGPIPRKISYGYGGGYGGYGGGFSRSSSNKFDIKNINAKANHDWTALHFAAAGGFVEMCEFLVSVKYVNANARDSTGMTPLHLAVLHEKIEAVRFLSNVPDVYVNSQDNEGRTPLHLACSMGEVDIIKLLVKCKEIDLTKLDKKSQTAFKHLTVENQKALAHLFK